MLLRNIISCYCAGVTTVSPGSIYQQDTIDYCNPVPSCVAAWPIINIATIRGHSHITSAAITRQGQLEC